MLTSKARSSACAAKQAAPVQVPVLGHCPDRTVRSHASNAKAQSRIAAQLNQRKPRRNVVASASEFDVDSATPQQPRDTSLGPRDDDVLPESLADALKQAAEATAEAIQRSNSRCQVEILLTEFWDPISGPLFPNRGDQERFWKMTKRFVEELGAATRVPGPGINAVYPDSGVAAMLSYQWKDPEAGGALPFRITSLTDRLPVAVEDELIVVACPDPPGAEECMRLVRMAGEQDEREGREYRPIVLFNPRLSSGDVGLGLNARRLRENFTKNFVVTYSLRPIGDVGSVYRRYPGMWKVFLEEPTMPGRYKMIAEKPARPAGEMLDYIIMEAENPTPVGPDGKPVQATGQQGFFNQVQAVVRSLNYFMKSLSS